MVRKGFTPEQIINRLREAEIHINQGISIAEASRKIGLTQQSRYHWRREYGGPWGWSRQGGSRTWRKRTLVLRSW